MAATSMWPRMERVASGLPPHLRGAAYAAACGPRATWLLVADGDADAAEAAVWTTRRGSDEESEDEDERKDEVRRQAWGHARRHARGQ